MTEKRRKYQLDEDELQLVSGKVAITDEEAFDRFITSRVLMGAKTG